MEKIIVIIAAIALIGFIIWWFFGKRKVDQTASKLEDGKQSVKITVNGGYTPNVVVLRQNVPATVVFYRKDPSPCLSHVVFPDFGINDELPIDKDYAITIDTSKPGEYRYACGMDMFRGKVIVE